MLDKKQKRELASVRKNFNTIHTSLSKQYQTQMQTLQQNLAKVVNNEINLKRQVKEVSKQFQTLQTKCLKTSMEL
jgi:hypothetical protein